MIGSVLRRPATAIGFVAATLLGLTASAQPPASLELALVDLDGRVEVLGVVPPSVFAPRVSPDGQSVVFETIDGDAGGTTARLWVAELRATDARRPMPQVEGPINWAALWTTDGDGIVFVVSGPSRPDTLFRRSAEGTVDGEPLLVARSAEAWTPDGRHLTYLTLQGDDDYGISLLDVETGETRTLIDLPGSAEHSSNISPDGRWLAFTTNESGRFEVWVAPLANPSDRHPVTRDGGGHPLWSPDGRKLYFNRDRHLYEVSIETSADHGVEVGAARPLPISGFEQGLYRRQFDLMPDGRAFLVLLPAEPAAPPSATDSDRGS